MAKKDEPVADPGADLELFAEFAAWLPGPLYGNSIIGLSDWIAHQADRSRSNQEGREELLQALRSWLSIDSPEQVAAEKTLVRLLTEIELQRSGVRSRHSEQIGRDVDWGRTYADSVSRTPARFWCRERVRVPDRSLRGGLLWLARAWHRLLENDDEDARKDGARRHGERIQQLARVLHPPRSLQLRERPLSRSHLDRLRHSGVVAPADLRNFERAVARQLSLPAQPTRRKHLRRYLDESVERRPSRKKGPPAMLPLLLELSVRMAIVRAACERPEKGSDDAWQPWRLIPAYQTDEVFTLRSPDDDLECQVAGWQKLRDKDVTTHLRHVAGMDPDHKARDSQPDIHLLFRRVGERDDGESGISVLGDSKRNGDGTGLFRDGLRTATFYMLAYHNELGLKVGEGVIEGPVHPAFTLFFRQGVEWPPGEDPLLDLRDGQDADDQRPVLLAMDMDNHFGATRDGWNGGAMRRWFRALARQAAAHLAAPL